MKYRIWMVAAFALLLIAGCKSIDVKEREEMRGNILFKKLMNRSSVVSFGTVSGLIMINGNPAIPAVYIKYTATADFKSKDAVLKLAVLSKPLLDLYMNHDTFVLVNHTGKEYIELNLEDVDFSKILGINFDPVELSYLLTGNIPYSGEMQLVSFENTKTGAALMNITDTTTNFFVQFDTHERISSIKVENQFFDKLTVENLTYAANNNENDIDVPQKIKVSSDTSKVTMTFLIRSIDYNQGEIEKFTNALDYTKLDNIEKINIKLK